jgi:GT2 family glycosyltransferase
MAEDIKMKLIKAFGELRGNVKVTVVIVNYNAGAILINCIQRVLASSSNIDIIIVDNASSDASLTNAATVFQDIENLCIYQSANNLGFARANNYVYSLIQSDYILYLNPDCYIEPSTIQNMLALMETHPGAGMAGCLILNEDGSEQKGCRGLTPTPWRSMMQILQFYRLFPQAKTFQGYTLNHMPLPKAPIKVELISGAFMFARRQAISEVGLLDEHYFLYCEDYDWFYRFQQKRWEILFTPNLIITHLKGICGKKTPTRISWYKTKGMLYYYKKFFQKNRFSLITGFIKFTILSRFFIVLIVNFLKRQPKPN